MVDAKTLRRGDLVRILSSPSLTVTQEPLVGRCFPVLRIPASDTYHILLDMPATCGCRIFYLNELELAPAQQLIDDYCAEEKSRS